MILEISFIVFILNEYKGCDQKHTIS